VRRGVVWRITEDDRFDGERILVMKNDRTKLGSMIALLFGSTALTMIHGTVTRPTCGPCAKEAMRELGQTELLEEEQKNNA
jgi:hypothetical protein